MEIRSLRSLTAVSEQDLLQDVIYSLQGIEGKFLRREPGGLGFTIDPKSGKLLTSIQRGLLERLVGMSFLHKQLKQYIEDNEKQSGIICQAFISTLSDELSEYYKTVAVLQASMNKDNMTKKGGALITAIHGFLQHGSKCAQEVSERVLRAVCKPLYIMLARWLLDGEINDPCNEFFIESKSIIVAERLWHDKYYVRQSMVPSFISMDQAKKILATGKCINFLRQICKDGSHLPGRESLQKLFRTTSGTIQNSCLDVYVGTIHAMQSTKRPDVIPIGNQQKAYHPNSVINVVNNCELESKGMWSKPAVTSNFEKYFASGSICARDSDISGSINRSGSMLLLRIV
ncbi:hypothetical protein NQ315_006029 [Exocentrus adspersus]|uniref:Gamma tubulin complex component protein N-terminal domain-containing protein n=1 Tax=Exocentrus adspersus TaxID=1586481 RepID=A0AAV8VB94_9CUCU|nr:hypothetical protein NQ315_006029 [Exocentrus adspersus]